MHHKGILILDFGSQFTQLIARRIREMNVYCEIHPCTEPFHEDWTYDGIVLSGGPASVLGDEAPDVDERWLQPNTFSLGVCYGFQMMAVRSGCQLERGQKRIWPIYLALGRRPSICRRCSNEQHRLDESW